MSQPNATRPGSPCWIDLMTSDVDGCRAFYEGLFGWKAAEGSAEFGGYFMFLSDGVPVAGAMPLMPPVPSVPPVPGAPEMDDVPDNWGVYLAVADAASAASAVRDAGGVIEVEPMAIADLGLFAIAQDPTGARIGLWQAETFAGFGATGVVGAPSWFELHTSGYDPAIAFYRDALGWDPNVVSEGPEFRYATLGKDDQASAGIMDAAGFLPSPADSHWVVYFGVRDVDQSLAQAEALRGSVIEPAVDTPYGRMATLADPSGAQFKLLGLPV